MKKFSKIFLTISGILAILGIVLIIAGVSMGGAKSVASDLLNNRLAIRLGDSFYTVDERFESMNNIGEENKFSVDEVNSFVLKGNAGEYEISVWDEKEYCVQVLGGSKYTRYLVENGVLTIATDEQSLIGWANTVKLKIYVPKEVILENATLNVGAGTLQCSNINANNLEVNIGAGEGRFNNVVSANAKFNVGAGDGEINNATFTECELKVGIGDIDLNGNISGHTDIDCGVGNVELELSNIYTDFDYSVKVGAGDVKIGGEKYSGLSNSLKLNNNANNVMNIKCGLGDVSVAFFH